MKQASRPSPSRGRPLLATIGVFLLSSACLHAASGVIVYDPAFEGLRSFRIAVAILDPEECLRIVPEDFERPIRDFFANEGEDLREMVSDDSGDYVAVVLEAHPAASLGIRIGTYGTLRVQLRRQAVVRRTGDTTDVPVWDHSVGYFLRTHDPALDTLLDQSRVLLRRFQRMVLQMPPIPGRANVESGTPSPPCPPFRPGHVRFGVPVNDPDDLLSFSRLEVEHSILQDLQRSQPDLAARLSPLGDNALELRIDCRTIEEDDVEYGISGAVRCTFREPVFVNRGRTCTPGMTWSAALAFFVDEPEQADAAARQYAEQLLASFAVQPVLLSLGDPTLRTGTVPNLPPADQTSP